MTQNWQPVLEGDLADRAWDAIAAIARDIGSPNGGSPNGGSPNGSPDDGATTAPSSEDWALAGGAAGKALFFAYLSQADGDESAAELAAEHLEDALAGAARHPLAVGLWEGVQGVAWSYDHLADRIFEAEDEDGESDADELLSRLLEGHSRIEVYDLIQGLTGFGVACLEGLPRLGSRRGLDLVLDHLLRTAETLDTGIGWFTRPELLVEWQRELAPEGYYNVGAAHGIPAIVTLLARCVGLRIRAGELAPVLEGTVDWLLAQRRKRGFPSWVAKGRPRQDAARLAWCYGDPGVAGALWAAGQACDRPSWQAEAVDVARRAAERDPEDSGIQDAGICHGTAGVAHIFNRLYQASGCERLGQAARYWFADTLDRRLAGEGVGGFRSWSQPRGQVDAKLEWVDEPGLLTGAAGIGLCLLAAVGEHEPEWDRTLLLSAPRS